jgi:hypothetical protein
MASVASLNNSATSLAPDPVPGARRAPRTGVPARRADDVRAVGSALDGQGAPEPVGADLGVGPGLAPVTGGLSAVVDAAIAVVLIALAWRPLARPLLLQFLALGLVVDLGANVPFVPGMVIAYSSLLLLLFAHPEPRRLLTPFWRGPIDWRLLTLALVALDHR